MRITVANVAGRLGAGILKRQCLLAVLVLAASADARAQDIDKVVAALKDSESAIQSMQAVFLHEQTTFPEFVKYYKLDEPPQTVRDLSRVRWAFRGPDHAAFTTALNPKTGQVQIKHESFEIVKDNRTYTGAFVPKLSNTMDGAVQLDVMERIIYPASPYRLSTAPFGQPLSLMITEGKFRALRDAEYKDDGRVIVLHGVTKSGLETRLFLSERYGWSPLKIEQITEDGNALRVIEHEDFAQMEGVWLPMESTDSFRMLTGKRAVLVEHNFRVDPNSIQVNSVPASFFDIPIKNGSVVRNRVDNDFYRISMAGRKVGLEDKYLPDDRRISKHSYLGFLFIGGLAAIPVLGLIAFRRLSR